MAHRGHLGPHAAAATACENRAETSAAGLSPAAFARVRRRWLIYSLVVVLFAGVVTFASPRFGYDVDVTHMPIVELVGLLVLAGALFAIYGPAMIRQSTGVSRPQECSLLAILVVAGLSARLILLVGEPILENDYHRYLWDGAVTAHGYSPYSVSPQTVLGGGAAGALGPLAEQSSETLEKIGHKGLTTIYPPVAQAMFALAYAIEPWSLGAWRLTLLLADTVTLLLLVTLLRTIGRSPLWSAVYWLNPLVLKETFNSAHMEPILLPLVLSTILFANRRPLIATLALGLAAGVKLWPIVLAPLLWRGLLRTPQLLAAAAVMLAALMSLWLLPFLTTAPGETSGLAAYLEGWKTNSALSPALEGIVTAMLGSAGFVGYSTSMLTKALVGLVLVAVVLSQAWHAPSGLEDLVHRASVVVAALVLLSPAQYPWYAIWLAPFLAFRPYRGFLLLTATMPLYYLSFYFAAQDAHEIFTRFVVWIIWLPVWCMLAWDGMRATRRRTQDVISSVEAMP